MAAKKTREGSGGMDNDMEKSRSRRTQVSVAMVFAASLLAACSNPGKSMSSTSTAALKASTAGANAPCGTSVPVGPSNPNGIYHTLPASLKSVYISLPYALNASVWEHHSRTKGPWKIGYIAEPIGSAYQQDVLTGMQADFAKAKAEGLVEGSLITNIPATQAASSPEQQI